jgi:hydroxymethylpyrimidine pyrophosphatase-like HAD family hydrolase
VSGLVNDTVNDMTNNANHSVNLQKLVFLDLDDTLFQTSAKCPADTALIAATVDQAGRDHSFMSTKQQAFLRFLLADAMIIPTTGRSVAAFARLKPALQRHFCHGAIIEHGAVVLDRDGGFDEAWWQRTQAIGQQYHQVLVAALSGLQELLAGFGPALTFDLRLHGISHPQQQQPAATSYALAKAKQADPMALAEVYQAVSTLAEQFPGLHCFSQGRAITFMPPELSKTAAVQYLLTLFGPNHVSFGIGDALSDQSFMACCDYAITPKRSQIQQALLGVSHVTA